ncbi:MAG TPA: dihydroneopterin aldolase [Dehalococcoidia bacterium]|nr:dihydroneopterin aldolase [Chloroflexota bacterium]HCI85238.1 dihydroneopterin aldolase [Dehalococcoidia bacterium]|tara:strand:+ start:12911 stop:13285 length:375 start_codon:yes stop_codon:yes gene_type:complete
MPDNSNQLDTVRIEQLELDCIIGINPWERLTKQRVTIDIEMNADLTKAGASDAIEYTINYRTISKAIISEIEESSYGLVEALAARIAEICLQDPLTQSVEVTVRKPGAVRNASAVGVVVRRSRS